MDNSAQYCLRDYVEEEPHFFIPGTIVSFINTFSGTRGIDLSQIFFRGKIIGHIFMVLYSLQTALLFLLSFNAAALQSMVDNDVTGEVTKVQKGQATWRRFYKQ